MILADVIYLPETPAHDAEIEAINEEAFGPGRFARAAYKIREGGPHERALSFVAVRRRDVVASVRMTRIAAGEGRALLLGPLAVRPAFKNLGIGRQLVAIALEAADKAGAPAVDAGRRRTLLRPARLQAASRAVRYPCRARSISTGFSSHEIAPGAVARLTGEVCHADRGARFRRVHVPVTGLRLSCRLRLRCVSSLASAESVEDLQA